MFCKKSKGITLIELMMALGISGLLLMAIINIADRNLKSMKESRIKELKTQAYDKVALENSNSDLTLEETASERNNRICSSLGFDYDNSNSLSPKCKIKKFNCIPSGSNTCFVTIREAMCELEKRGRSTTFKMCLD